MHPVTELWLCAEFCGLLPALTLILFSYLLLLQVGITEAVCACVWSVSRVASAKGTKIIESQNQVSAMV
jgi:hypothetical protein